MKVFMLGWEFPPHISGGLGTACYGMTKALDEIGVDVDFVLPTAVPDDSASHVRLRTPHDLPVHAAAEPLGRQEGAPGADRTVADTHMPDFRNVEMHRLPAVLQTYATPTSYAEAVAGLSPQQREQLRKALADAAPTGAGGDQGQLPAMPVGSFTPGRHGAHYGGDLIGQVHRYAALAVELARSESFDVIHAHDWMTYPAGLAVAAATHKPLVVHVHSTEFDRSGENIDHRLYEIERAGMHGATHVVCVSYLTRGIVINRYGVDPDRIDVVYNATELPINNEKLGMKPIRHSEKIVLFLGRVTMQKGPEYFLRAAKKVVGKFPNVRFVIAGSGDMIAQCVREVADLKLGRYVTFTGFLRGGDVGRIFQMADLYVMPSVSEPFGIAPLEALSHNVPVIISKQSGVSEVLSHVLKVDFWDIDEMANKILAVLRHPPLQRTLRHHGAIELRKFSWRDSAVQLEQIYSKLAKAN